MGAVYFSVLHFMENKLVVKIHCTMKGKWLTAEKTVRLSKFSYLYEGMFHMPLQWYGFMDK